MTERDSETRNYDFVISYKRKLRKDRLECEEMIKRYEREKITGKRRKR